MERRIRQGHTVFGDENRNLKAAIIRHVAMSLKDSMVERASGRIVEGGEWSEGHRIVDL